MEADRDNDLATVWAALVKHLEDPMDRLAPARMAACLLLASEEASGDAADDLWAEHGERLLQAAEPTPDRTWVARRIAQVHPDPSIRARARLAVADASQEHDRAAELLEGLDDLDSVEEPAQTAARLQNVSARLEHANPLLATAIAQQHEAAEEFDAAGQAFERAAEEAAIPEHRLPLLYAAGRNHEHAGNAAKARTAYLAASHIDVTHHDVFERLRDMLEAEGDTEELSGLADRRLAAGGDVTVMRSLRRTQASLKATLGDRAGARDALRAALQLDPQDVDALRRLAELSLTDQDWRGAAEALIRFARLQQDRDDLRWVFFTLGDIYQRHMPDARRAEAALRRVLKLVPEDLEAMDRLASLYESEELYDRAATVVQQLVETEIDPDARLDHRIRLARAIENAADPRAAERVLEESRRESPTHLGVLRAMSELYERQNASAAQSMHLGRAIGDFRRALERDMANSFAWEGLAQLLEWRGQPDAGRAIASAAVAIGLGDGPLVQRVDSAGAIPGAGAAAGSAELHEVVAPAALSAATFEVFRLGQEVFDKVLPFDPRAWKTEKVGRDHPLRAEAQRVAQWFGHSDVQILLTDAAPRICVPVGSAPLTLVVGRALSTATDAHERAFLFARATKVASVNLSVAMRSHPGQLALCFAGLAKTYDPMYQRADMEPRAIDEWARKVGRAIPRRVRDDLGPVAIEVVASPHFDATHLGLAGAELGDRVALLALGSTPAATSALLALADRRPPDGSSPHERAAALREVPEAWDLLRFAASDAYFEARQRAGVGD